MQESPRRQTMREIFEVLVFVVIGAILLRFGYTLFLNLGIPASGGGKGFWSLFRKRRELKPKGSGTPGDPQTCPVCSAKLDDGQLVSSLAFPSMNGGKDRFMHIRGCTHCLYGNRERVCPVCVIILRANEILICRLFERPGRRAHVHVLGCTKCKGPRSGR